MEFGDLNRKVPHEKNTTGREEAPTGESLTTGGPKREGRAELPPPSTTEVKRPDAYLAGVDPSTLLEFDNGKGRPMVARILSSGDPYGLEGCLAWQQEPNRVGEGNQVGIEFYDATCRDSRGFGRLGQFVSRYNLSTLTGEDVFGNGDAHVTGRLGLDLHGAVPEWEITGPKISDVLAWAKGVVASRQQTPEMEAVPGPQHSRVNAHGCLVFHDDNARHKLAEWGYPPMGGSRYPFDENLKGWEQFDTDQDAPYYGIWTSVDRMATVSYTEGDITLVVAPDAGSFKAEVRSLWDWNYNRRPDHGAHTQLDSPKLHAACLVGHPPFDKVLGDYKQLVIQGRQYEELHNLAFEKLQDPSLPKGQFRVLEIEGNVYFLSGRAVEPRAICVCRKEGYDLNNPDHILPPWPGADASKLATQIKLLEEFVTPLDRNLASKIQAMQRGEQMVLSDKECDAIAELDAEWTGRFATMPNPNQVGTLDAWVGFIQIGGQNKEALKPSSQTPTPAEAPASGKAGQWVTEGPEAVRVGQSGEPKMITVGPNPFPEYHGEALSWSVGLYMTAAESREDYPRARAVAKALKAFRPAAFEREKQECLKATFGMFSTNARAALRIYEEA